MQKFEREIYRPAFPDDNQREDVNVWLDLLHDNPGSPAPYLTVLMAVNGFGYVGGALVLEHYRRSGIALVTYVAISPRYRSKGLARRLVNGALDVLAWSEGRKPIPMLAEMDDPERTDRDKQDAAVTRAKILHALGILKCELPYVQPALAKGGGRLSHMLLCAHGKSLINGRLDAERLKAFLHEFYQSLGIVQPELDPDFLAMASWLEEQNQVVFVPLVKEEGAP